MERSYFQANWERVRHTMNASPIWPSASAPYVLTASGCARAWAL